MFVVEFICKVAMLVYTNAVSHIPSSMRCAIDSGSMAPPRRPTGLCSQQIAARDADIEMSDNGMTVLHACVSQKKNGEGETVYLN